MDRLAELARRHEELKKRIHAYRMPIHSKWGRAGMGLVYFTTPLLVGYFVMQWTNGLATKNLGAAGEREKLLAAAAKWKAEGGPQTVLAQAPPPPARQTGAAPTKIL